MKTPSLFHQDSESSQGQGTQPLLRQIQDTEFCFHIFLLCLINPLLVCISFPLWMWVQYCCLLVKQREKPNRNQEFESLYVTLGKSHSLPSPSLSLSLWFSFILICKKNTRLDWSKVLSFPNIPWGYVGSTEHETQRWLNSNCKFVIYGFCL